MGMGGSDLSPSRPAKVGSSKAAEGGRGGSGLSREFSLDGVLRVGVVLEELALLLLPGRKRDGQPGGIAAVALVGWRGGWLRLLRRRAR